MFSFSSPFSVSLERMEECAAKNTVPGFEIPGLAEVAGILASSEADTGVIHEKLLQGCGSLLNAVANEEFRAFFAEILFLLEEQGSRICLQIIRENRTFQDDEFFALPLLLADFYRLAAQRFSDGNLYTLFETEITLDDAAAFVSSLNMPEILKKYLSGFCADESVFDGKSAALKKILPNLV